VSFYRLRQGRSILVWGKFRTDDGRGYVIDDIAALALITHQRFERGEDNGEVRIIETCHLVTERFTPPRTLDDKQSFALHKLLDDVTLPWMKPCRDMETFFEELFRWVALSHNTRRCH